MKFEDILKEKKILITGATKTGKRYKLYKGINYIVLDENEPLDVHGIPSKLEAYGRGWLGSRGIEIDGGPNGSSQGHPSWAKEDFYWGIDKDAFWTGLDNIKRKGVFYIRGRAGTSFNWLEKNIIPIMNLVFNKIPK